jgi:signal transduction histidine kinase
LEAAETRGWFGVQQRLILTFGLFALAVFGVGGFLVYERMRQAVEQELGEKLLTVGTLVAAEITEDQRRLLVASGGVQTRTSLSVSRELSHALQTAGLYKLFIFDDLGRSLADADGREPGAPYPELEFEREALAGVFAGEPVVSHLFTSRDGRIHKAAYLPLPAHGETRASLAVMGSATFLDAIREVRNGMLVAAVIGLAASIALSLLMAQSIVRPIRRLVASADRIRSGDLETPVAEVGTDEIGYLGRTLERMRDSVLARDRSLRAMLGGVAHEIRNPLGGIELFAGLLRRRVADDEKAVESADRVLHEVRQLDDIIKDFLEYARPAEPTWQRVHVGELARDARDVVSSLLAERDVTLEIEGDVEVEVDPAQLRRVLINLVMNAAQAIDGGGAIAIRSREVDGTALVDVVDDGPGIPEDVRERVFEPFYTTRQQGSGLGLTIARDLVERNRGTLRIVRSDATGTALRMEWRSIGGSR